MAALNIDLYERLRQRFGRVVIANEGEATVPHISFSAGHAKVHLDPEGEMYRICCPICTKKGTPDRRFRLYINHLWGVGHPRYPDDKFWWAAHCFNEKCMCDPASRKYLRDVVYDAIGRDIQRIAVPAAIGDVNTDPMREVTLPGKCVPVAELEETHKAKVFLRTRGFDPNVVGERYGLQYCLDVPGYTKLQIVIGRIIAPFYMRGKMVGWQARYVGNANLNRTVKYFTCPGMRTGRVLYDFDNALKSNVVFVCEGITDVWRVGTGAVALCGKNFTAAHSKLITDHWQTAIVLLDPDADAASIDVYSKLAGKMRAVRVTLPAQTDPAALEEDFLWEQIYMAGVREKCDLAELMRV